MIKGTGFEKAYKLKLVVTSAIEPSAPSAFMLMTTQRLSKHQACLAEAHAADACSMIESAKTDRLPPIYSCST
jgi:hypothetical protein